MRKSEFQKIQKIVKIALDEDIGSGDVTSELTIPERQRGKGFILAKEKGIIAGLEVVKSVFHEIDPRITFKPLGCDGDEVKQGQKVVSIQGKVKSILAGERTALNYLQRLSGIATLTNEFVRKTKGTSAKILDTRKTIPGLRFLEKYAVKKGGGENHRQGLYDMILIKDNHIQAAGSISATIRKAQRNRRGLKIEVETKNLKEIKEALNFKIDRIMLDNFKLADLKKAVRLIRSKNKKVEIEASGRVNLKNVRKIALSGIDYISIGALTHSAKALDFSLLLK
ncbi:MAG TPA: carboxylating nicotinate-nucleotide diphosphorylase [Terriglobales bacterium]|nr:carboxylating nicotinate-nucleotide diphosphorylase [Terriglobales bacterium]